MYCQKCGNNLVEGVQFCPRCGQATGATAPQIPAVAQLGEIKLPASNWQRLANSLIDGIILAALYFFIGRFLAPSPGVAAILIIYLIKYGIFFAYYLIFEGIFGRTIGKFITGTKILDENGDKPYFGKIIIRTFFRLIPFEPLSFLTASHARGWHDTLSRTFVVPVSCTSEDVRQMSAQGIQGGRKSWWLLAVILLVLAFPVVGIIGAVVLSSFSGAQYSALIQKNLSQLQSNSLSYFNEGKNNNYAGFCSDPESVRLIQELNNEHACNDSPGAWAFSVRPTHGSVFTYMCVDSVRSGITTTSHPLGSSIVCPSE